MVVLLTELSGIWGCVVRQVIPQILTQQHIPKNFNLFSIRDMPSYSET